VLFSERLKLVGRPDRLVRQGEFVIPEEGKPSAKKVYDGHRLQLGADFLLVEEEFGVRPPFGVVVVLPKRASPRLEVAPERSFLKRTWAEFEYFYKAGEPAREGQPPFSRRFSGFRTPGPTTVSILRLRFLWQSVFGHVRHVQVAVDYPIIGGPLGAIPEEDLVGIAELDPFGPVAESSLERPCCHHEANE
jgi:hypothetical protein